MVKNDNTNLIRVLQLKVNVCCSTLHLALNCRKLQIRMFSYSKCPCIWRWPLKRTKYLIFNKTSQILFSWWISYMVKMWSVTLPNRHYLFYYTVCLIFKGNCWREFYGEPYGHNYAHVTIRYDTRCQICC